MQRGKVILALFIGSSILTGYLWLVLNETQQELDDARQELRQQIAKTEEAQSAANTLAIEHQRVTAEKEILATALEQREERVDELEAQKTELTLQYQELENMAGTLPDMTSEIEQLEAEIARLKKDLSPLRTRAAYTHTGGFLCTGSMEPVITCLDRVTWQTRFTEEDITVGTIIAFSQHSPCLGGRGGFNVGHRVYSINRSDPFNPRYITKGDAVDRTDECTIVFSDIEGYVIAIHKNVVMANTELRNNVNSARDAYEAARDEYYGAGFYVERLYNEAVAAWEYYDCWYANAWYSEYPGHIPHTCNPEDLARQRKEQGET